MHVRAFFLLAFASFGTASPLFEMEPDSYSPNRWQKTGRAPKDAKIQLNFMVKQTNMDKLEAIFHLVSDPTTPFYGKHLTNQEVHTLVAPKPESLETLRQYLSQHGLTGEPGTPNGDMILVTTTIEKAEEILNTQYYTHQHDKTHQIVLRCSRYSLPSEVAEVLDLVAPTTSFPSVKDRVFTDRGSNLTVSAQKLRSLYSVNDFVGGKAKGNRHAVTGFLKQFFHQADLAEFWKLYMSGIDAESPIVNTVGDGVNKGFAGVEAELDIEYINALGAGIPSEFWGFLGASPDNPANEPFLKWLQVMHNTSDDKVPLIFSTSYGEGEQTTTLETATRTNNEFIKAGTRGISLLFASGDDGAGCNSGKFEPKWPAGSPYVTGVGGTTGVPETAVGLASGGFCNRWPTQHWQADAVKEYLSSAKGIPDQKLFNNSGRGFPDISAQATGFTVVSNLIPMPGVAGTSCASPTASGVFAALNEVRLAAGKSSLGFLNPFIYQNMDKFNDITQGSNDGCDGSYGFPASKGWDPVTGVGTPNFEKLKEAVLALP